jgi:succinate dehydrogenase / fumarate reductase membrane anchor subunit
MTEQSIKPKANYETTAWLWMRYSSMLLIPLVWIHVLWQDVIIGVHNINLNYVVQRWSNIGIQIYDILLLAFAFAHGMNGLRQVFLDIIHTDRGRRIVSITLFIVWIVISTIGATAILAAAKANLG